MGMIRKLTSISTLGIVPYRNRDERRHHVAKQTRNATRALVVQQAAMLEVSRQQVDATIYGNAQREQWQSQVAAERRLPGWYAGPNGTEVYWTGQEWIPGSMRRLSQS